MGETSGKSSEWCAIQVHSVRKKTSEGCLANEAHHEVFQLTLPFQI